MSVIAQPIPVERDMRQALYHHLTTSQASRSPSSPMQVLPSLNKTANRIVIYTKQLGWSKSNVTKITYVEHNGAAHVLDIAPGKTLMEGARDNNVTGIVADCGGACACSTCHVYIDEAWVERMPPLSEIEKDMLEFAAEPVEHLSRLSCQIKISDGMDGLIVKMPKSQTGM
jgi:ferredoxin, 2Fe-2S